MIMEELVTAASRQGPAVPKSRRTGPALAVLIAAYALLALLLAAPLLAVEVPLGGDTLNHLARIHVRAHIADDPDLARLFEIRDVLVPYMGLDWLLTPLARVMPTLVVGRIAIVLLLWGMVGAVLVLQRTFTGRIGFEPLLMGLVSYNALLGWGFLNYALGVIGALLGLAAWHRLRGQPWLLRLALFTMVATLMYFVHLFALALYGVMLGAYEVFGRGRPCRTPVWDWILLAAQFLPATILWIQLAMPPGGESGMYWLPQAKLQLLTSPFLFSGASGGLDPGIVVCVGCLFLLVRSTRSGLLRWNRRLGAIVLVLVLMGLMLPTQVFGVFLVDLRFPVATACLTIAALQIVPGADKRLLPLGMLLIAATLVQVWSAGAAMRACDRHYSELRTALRVVPRGAILTAVKEVESPAPGVRCSDLRVYDHIPQLITLERSGYSPDFFARVTAVAVRGNLPTDEDPWPAHLVTSDMLPPSGYLLWMHFGNHDRLVPPGLMLLHKGSFFDIFLIL